MCKTLFVFLIFAINVVDGLIVFVHFGKVITNFLLCGEA